MLSLYILFFITFLLILNFCIMYIYSSIARRKYISNIKQRKNISSHFNVKTRPKNNTFKRYLSGLLRYELRLIGNIPSHRVRKFIYSKVFLMKIGKNSIIYGGAEVRAPWNIKIGRNSIIGDEAKLDGRNGLIIKNNVNFSTGVWVWTDQHQVNSRNFESLPIGKGKVIIEDYCWCGPRTIILPGKRLKKGSVVAAGGVLTKNTEEYGIYAGVPACKIAQRNHDINYVLSGSYLPFF